MVVDRRELVAGLTTGATLAALGWGSEADAQREKPLFAGTAMANNAMARHFHRVDMKLPTVSVLSGQGSANLSDVGGKTRLIALWSEWCVPCLVEIRDFAVLRPQVANDRFDIGLLLTASNAKLDHAGASARIQKLGAGSLPLLVEPNGGNRAAMALADPTGGAGLRPGLVPPAARRKTGFAFPCTLLVDSRGRVRGRTFGAPMQSEPGADGRSMSDAVDEQKAMLAKGQPIVGKALTDAEKDALLAQGKTMWSGPAGLELMKALASGLFDRV